MAVLMSCTGRVTATGRLAAGPTLALLIASLPVLARAAEPAQGNAAPRAVTVVKAERQCFPLTVQVTGHVAARSEIPVRPDRDGYQTAEIVVEPGATVKTGDVLARLRPLGAPPAIPPLDLVSPADGVVLSASNVIGAPVSASGDPLFKIARGGELELVGDVAVSAMQRLAPKQAAVVEPVGLGEVDGTTRTVSAAVDPITQLGQVTVTLASNPRILPGVFARATIKVDERCRPAVPLSAVLYGPSGPYLQIVRDERVETRPITLGEIRGGTVEVREGMADGETALARAGSFVRNGDRVRAISVGTMK